MRGIRILSPVLSDIDTAASWYDENGYEGLGERFIRSFYASLTRIQTQGEMYRISYRDFRKFLIPSFPYFIYFSLHSDEWIVPLVIHTSRRPSLTKTLLNQRTKAEQADAGNRAKPGA